MMITVEKKDADGNEKERRNEVKAKATKGKSRRKIIVGEETIHHQIQMIQVALLLLSRSVAVGSVIIRKSMKGIGKDATNDFGPL